MKKRKAKFKEFKRFTEHLIKQFFGKYLQHRGNSGTVVFTEPVNDEVRDFFYVFHIR